MGSLYDVAPHLSRLALVGLLSCGLSLAAVSGAAAAPTNSSSSSPSVSVSASASASTSPSSSTSAPASTPGFSATLTVVSTQGSRSFQVTSDQDTVGSVLERYGIASSQVRASTGGAVDTSAKFTDEALVTVFRVSHGQKQVTVSIPHTEVDRPTDTLPTGTRQTVQNGVDGSGIDTTVSTTNPLSGSTGATTTQDTLTVLVTPVPTVVLVGTGVTASTAASSSSASSAQASSAQTSSTPAASSTSSSSAASTAASSASATASTSGDTSATAASAPAVQSGGSVQSATYTPASQAQVDAAMTAGGYKWGVTSPQVASLLSAANAGNSVVQAAIAQVGKPYVWGATGPDAFDCSGLILWLRGGAVPRTAAEQGAAATPESYASIVPGDIVWDSEHIGIYVGNNVVVHAANSNTGVVFTSLSWFQQNGFAVGRL